MEPPIKYPKTHSCDACSSITTFAWDNSSDKNLFSLTLAQEGRTQTWNPVGTVRYGDAVRLGQSGCDLMKQLTASCPREDASDCLVARPSYADSSTYRSIYKEQFSAYSDIRKIEIFFAWQSAKGRIGPDDWKRTSGAVLCVLPNDPAASEITVRPPNMYPASCETMELARGWLEECVTKHKRCAMPYPANLGPKRLLHIDRVEASPGLRLRVVECSNFATVPPYVALSYCWGVPQTEVLSHHNRDAWACGIPTSAVPETIRDACKVARDLGLDYIWVDSLCIIQNDEQEKLCELAAMGSIYEHAHVTISAARAVSAGEGFLHPRHSPEDLVIPMPYQCKDGRPGSVLLWFNRNLQFTDPISRRGWTYQESILSPRLLTYGSHQVRWSCRALPPTNARVDGWSDGHLYVMSGFVDWQGIQTSKRKQPVSAGLWKSVIEHYTGRSLSYPADRLAAISAVAKKLHEITDNEYVAGLWRHCLPELLMWNPCNCVEPPVYTAPSWSWASLLGQVHFVYSSSGPHGVEVIDVKIETPAPHDPHGPVTGGFLRLRGMVAVANMGFEWDKTLRNEVPICRPPQTTQVPTLDRNSEYVTGRLDLEPPEPPGKRYEITVWMLRLDGNPSSHGNYGLMLLKLADGRFCRIGIYSGLRYGKPYTDWRPLDLIHRRSPKWVEMSRFKWKMRTITIV